MKKLEGGDRRSIGRVGEVVAEVFNDPSLFEVVFNGMLSDDPMIRMRSADAVEKITAKYPEYLRPYKEKFIQQVAKVDQQEVRWHVAQMFPRLELSEEERAVVVEILLDYLNDKSKIVKTSSMQALADFAERDAGLRFKVIKLLAELTRTGSPAMKSRGRKLLEKLNRYGTHEEGSPESGHCPIPSTCRWCGRASHASLVFRRTQGGAHDDCESLTTLW